MSEETITEEPAASEEEVTEEVEADEETEESKGSGPGFIRGIFFGMLAGATAATLFAPDTGEVLDEQSVPALGGDESKENAIAGRLQSVVSKVRSRVREASDEAQVAAQEAEAKMRTRFDELTED